MVEAHSIVLYKTGRAVPLRHAFDRVLATNSDIGPMTKYSLVKCVNLSVEVLHPSQQLSARQKLIHQWLKTRY